MLEKYRVLTFVLIVAIVSMFMSIVHAISIKNKNNFSNKLACVIIGVDDKSFMKDEVNNLTQILSSLGLKYKLFYTSDEFSFRDFEDCSIIIYHNMGWDWYDYKDGKSPLIYNILWKAIQRNIPILVLGDDPTWNAPDKIVCKVLHLHSASSNGPTDRVLRKIIILDKSYPIFNRPYGKVRTFFYRGDPDITEPCGPGKILAIMEGTNAPVVFVWHKGSERVAVINLNLVDIDGKVLAGRKSDINNIRILVMNTIYWLLYGNSSLECDFNGNGRLDIGDAILGLRILVGTYRSNVPCDLNHNGHLDIGDIILLLEKILNLS